MRPFPRTLAVVASAATAVLAPIALTTQALAAGDLYVAPTGLDTNPGTAAAPLKTVQAAVNKATAGTTIRLADGRYDGKVTIKTSGTATAPIRITAINPGMASLTYNSKPKPCDNSQPAADRTVTITNGADYWQIDNLAIHNGVWIAGKKSNTAYSWLTNLVKKNDWATRRAVPGHGSYNPAATSSVIPYLRSVTGTPDMDSADGIKLIGNAFTGRGIYGALTSYGVASNNTFSKIPCGIGPGIWLMTFSNRWQIIGNDVTDIAPSTRAHYMQEGIRLGSAANYNEVAFNTVHDLPLDGRGVNTDVDASWNYIHHNAARNVSIGYNDQMSGWGNRWEFNKVDSYRQYGMGFRLMDATLAQPSKASSTNGPIVRCNVATNPIGSTTKALGVGGIMNATFSSNTLPFIWISKNASTYWSKFGNTWNGSTVLPGKNPPLSSEGC